TVAGARTLTPSVSGNTLQVLVTDTHSSPLVGVPVEFRVVPTGGPGGGVVLSNPAATPTSSGQSIVAATGATGIATALVTLPPGTEPGLYKVFAIVPGAGQIEFTFDGTNVAQPATGSATGNHLKILGDLGKRFAEVGTAFAPLRVQVINDAAAPV